MSFRDTFDSIKGKLRSNPDDGNYYDDDAEYDDSAYDDGYSTTRRQRADRDDDYAEGATSGMLGNTSRPEADSISVYTRSGRPVDTQPGTQSTFAPAPSARIRTYDRGSQAYPSDNIAPAMSYVGGTNSPSAAVEYTPRPSALVDAVPAAGATRVTSGQLPPYVLKPTSYDDVQTVIRRVRTNQPVVLAFASTNIETAKRILDFCFGLSCGIEGNVRELGDRVFVVEPKGITLSDSDVDKLVSSNVIKR